MTIEMASTFILRLAGAETRFALMETRDCLDSGSVYLVRTRRRRGIVVHWEDDELLTARIWNEKQCKIILRQFNECLPVGGGSGVRVGGGFDCGSS